MPLFTRPRRAHSEAWTRRYRAAGYRPAWRAAAEGAGVHSLVATPTGVTVTVPELVDVDGRELVLRLLPGQLPADLVAACPRIAPALGAARATVTPAGGMFVRLRLLDADPLAEPVALPALAPPGLIGVGEDQAPIVWPFAVRPHTVVQGQTGSGKSVWTYGQVAGAAADPAVLVTGIDPTGLLWRPFAGSRHAEWQVAGLADDLAPHVAFLERVVAEMDRRVLEMPDDADAVTCSPDLPVLLVVLEEYAGLLRAADLAGRDTGRRVRALVARLLSEGRKAGVRVLLVVQRADAAVVDGLARAQCGLRVSFSVDSGEAVKMLHPGVLDVADLLAAPPGVGLLTAPGVPLARFRAPLIGAAPYRAFVGRVRDALL